MNRKTILWFRQDLRLEDNPALVRAIQAGRPVVPVFVWAPEEEGAWAPGAASRWWLHHALADLDRQLRTHGSRLLLRRGPTREAILELARETQAAAVYWNRRYEPAVIARDSALKTAWRESGLDGASENAALLFEPHTIANREGRPFKVFTRYYHHCLTLPAPAPLVVDLPQLAPPARWPESVPLEDLGLLPRIRWDTGLATAWQPTAAGARDLLRRFLGEAVSEYAEMRNRPDRAGTSRLSPYLHFGQIGPRQLVRALADQAAQGAPGGGTFHSEIFWREFAHHILFHFPETPEQPLRPEFAQFPWQEDPAHQRAWREGRTGYPLVDAGLRELWTTGWMHNRVRMVCASFLIKHLLQPWTAGARWFWDTLVDADLAANTLGWQWTAGCGADAAPYFRVFNPVTQGVKFDPEGHYVRRHVPELSRLPAEFIHAPWEAPAEVLARAGVRLGVDYPLPIVEHAAGRARALAAFEQLRQARPETSLTA